jgi:hypothetical protein
MSQAELGEARLIRMTNHPYQELDIWGCMNCNADKITTSFCECLDQGEVTLIQEGFFTLSSKVCLSIKGKHVMSNFQHSTR